MEQCGIHRLQVIGNGRREAHMRDDVFLDVDAGSDLDERDDTVDELEDRALGHIENRLVLAGILTRERHLLDVLDELLRRALFVDLERTIDNFFLRVCHERAGEHDLLGALGDVDEAAGAGEAVTAAFFFSAIFQHLLYIIRFRIPLKAHRGSGAHTLVLHV